VLIGGILLGLVAGLLLGGRLGNLADVRLRLLPLLFLAVIVRFGTETALAAGIDLVEALRVPLFVTAYGLLLSGLWANRALPGLSLAFVGILSNAIAIIANGGFMPIWEPSLHAAGFDANDVRTVFHVILDEQIDATFLLRAGPLGDVIPIPFPVVQNVASIGDLFLSAGLGFFLFATVLRTAVVADDLETAPGRLRGLAGSVRLPRSGDAATTGGVPTARPDATITAATGLTRGLAEATALEPPLILSGPGTGLSSPALAPLPGLEDYEPLVAGTAAAGVAGAASISTPAVPAIAIPRPTILDRARRHPYVRIALDPSFSALWSGQLISVFGDRVHLIAISALVYTLTGGSALATAFIFVATMIPNLFLSPIAGVYVDRWDPRQVMVISDLLRAATVLLIPIVAVISVPLVYPLIMVFASISVFFRPARVIMLPRLVREDDILPANSALWVGETLADLIGYPIAAVFVIAIGAALPLAFWFDAATYIASAVLIATISVRSVPRAEPAGERRRILDDLKAGWTFLRQDVALLGNTIQSAFGQIGGGMFTAVTYVYAIALAGSDTAGKGVFAGIETAIGAGNLIGGFLLGLVAARMARGRLIAAGFIVNGACIALMGIVGNVPLALGLAAGSGIANMVYIIPSQTLFQERTPPEMLGRVVGFRFAAVFGSITFAGALGGVLGEAFSPQFAVLVAGLIPLAAGVGGLFVRAVREA
jgi:predicted MFS family arabinose efflux permease